MSVFALPQRNVDLLEKQGIYISTNLKEAPGKTVFLFPGHGAQYPNMLKQLLDDYPEVQQTFTEADQIYMDLCGKKLTWQIFYENDEQKPIVEKNLQMAAVMQPAIFTANYAIYKIYDAMGVQPNILIGHSLGEIAALAASGVISFADGLRIAFYRAWSLDQIGETQRGTMLSLKINPASKVLDGLLQGLPGYYTVSLHNAPEQLVISGEQHVIQEIAERCGRQNITYHKLPVSHGFHSALLQPAVELFAEKLKNFTYSRPEIPVFSTISGRVYSTEYSSADEMAELLASQLITPFSFCDLIHKLYDDFNARIFIETGPRDILSKLVRDILKVKHKDVYVCASNIPALGDIVSLKRAETYLKINNLIIKQGGDNIMMGNALRQEDAVKEGNTIANKLKNIINYCTGYPYSLIEIAAVPMKRELALNDEVFKAIIQKICRDFNLSDNELLADDSISLQEICEKIAPRPKLVKSKPKGALVSISQATGEAKSNLVVKKVTRAEVAGEITGIMQTKTGYPVEMLEPDLDLEADLGIDSVKQAEILVQVQSKYGYEAQPDLNIKQFNTINKIIDYTVERISQSAEAITEQAEIETTANNDAIAVPREVVAREVTEIIQAKTGYPVEILEPDLDLEADLGIDSVKQAEILVQVQSRYGYDAQPDLDIKQFNTINKIIDYTVSRLNQFTGSDRKQPDKASDLAKERILHYSDKTDTGRYIPITVHRPYDVNNGEVYSFQGKNFIIVEDRINGEVTAELAKMLQEKGAHICILTRNIEKFQHISFIETGFTDKNLITAAFLAAKERLGTVHGIINLYPLTENFSYFAAEQKNWESEIESNFNVLFYGTRSVYEDLEKTDSGTAYFAATNIGGIFGLELGASNNPIGALTAGFVKSLQREIQGFYGKVIDLTDIADKAALADTLIQEFSLKENLIEIGYHAGHRKTVGVVPERVNVDGKGAPLNLNMDDVIVVSGGGRGIIFELVKGLAELYNATFIVTGRTALPKGDEEWIQMDEKEFAKYKTTFLLKTKAEKPHLTPMEAIQEYEKLRSARMLYHNIQEADKAGYKITYFTCDVSDRASVKQLADNIKSSFGKVTGIINGAGLGSFGKIPKKPERHTENVVKIKAHGFYNLYHEFKEEPLKFFASIGSISGRFGMDGQVDYAAGADIIARMSFQLARERPDLRCFVIGWTAWEETGMAASADVQKIQKEQRGLTYISVDEGVQKFLAELIYGCDYPEVLIFGDLGLNLPLGQMDLLDENKRKFTKIIADDGTVNDRISYPLLEKIVSNENGRMVAEKGIRPVEDIYMKDHTIEGKSVYAGVMHVEAFCELAMLMREITGENLLVNKIRNIDFSRFAKYFDGKPLTLKVIGELTDSSAAQREIHAEIYSDFCNEKGIILEKDRLHSMGNVVLTKERQPGFKAKFDIDTLVHASTPMNIEKFYQLTDKYISFGPSFRCLDYVGYINGSEILGVVTVPQDDRVFSYTAVANTLTSPIAIDNACRCILFSDFHQYGNIIVPRQLDEGRLYRPFKKGERVYTYCNLLAKKDDIADYNVQIIDENNMVIFEIDVLSLIKVNKENGDHLLF